LPRREITAPLISQFGWSGLILGLFAVLWGSLAWYLVRRDLHLSKLREDNAQLRELRRKDEQLLQAEKLATVGVLVSGLAHEIGTPLGIVAMRLQLMRRKTEEESDERRTLDVSLEQLDRVTGLIRQLLDFARSKPGLAQPVELPRMAQAIGNLVLPMAKRKQADLIFALPEDLPRISGMPDGIQQILLNLVMNALQAIGEGGKVLVRAEWEPNTVALTVDDDGPGIPEDQRAAIFDPFFTTKPQGEGSGLGLTVVLGLVRRMGAEMLVEESTLGGARFVIRFTVWGA
jgi:signal transduction histidine kinase